MLWLFTNTGLMIAPNKLKAFLMYVESYGFAKGAFLRESIKRDNLKTINFGYRQGGWPVTKPFNVGRPVKGETI